MSPFLIPIVIAVAAAAALAFSLRRRPAFGMGLVVPAELKPPEDVPGVPEATEVVLEGLTEPKRLAAGGHVRAFKAPMVAAIVELLNKQSELVATTVDGQDAFRIVSKPGGNAARIIANNQARGLAVLATLTAMMPGQPVRLLMFARPEKLAELAPPEGETWAVLVAPKGTYAGFEKPSEQPLDPDMPANLAAMVRALLIDKTKSPSQLRSIAADFADKGYPMSAALLRGAADARSLELRLAAEERGGTLYKLSADDSGSKLAQRVTGEANRWRELIGQKTADGRTITSYTDASGWPQLRPWKPGLTVLLPVSWEAWETREGAAKVPEPFRVIFPKRMREILAEEIERGLEPGKPGLAEEIERDVEPGKPGFAERIERGVLSIKP